MTSTIGNASPLNRLSDINLGKRQKKANFFANKGGKMRLVARKMRDKAEEMEEAKVDVRREDKAIRDFEIPVQDGLIKIVFWDEGGI